MKMATPLSRGEIIAQLPRENRAWKNGSHDTRDENLAKMMYGTQIQKLTVTLAQQLVGKDVCMICGQHWTGLLSLQDRVSHLSSLKITGFGNLDELIADITDTDGFIEIDADYIYQDGACYVTGSGSDPVYVFVH